MPCKEAQYMLSEDKELLAQLNANAPLKMYASNFLLYGGLLAGHADGNLDDSEKAYLIEALSPLYDSPEIMIECMNSPEGAKSSMEDTMEWLKENGGNICVALYRCLSCIVAADDVLDDGEKEFMDKVAKGLGIPADEGEEMVRQSFVPEEP